MNIETVRDHCLAMKGVEETFPFGEDTLVFKVGGKMFLLISLENPVTFNVKCDPAKAVQLRDEYTEVQPGYHMSKVHWNTVDMTGRLTDKQLKEMINDSCTLIVKSLPKAKQAEFER